MPNIPISYSEFVTRIGNGDIVFVGRGSILSWIIRTVTGKRWSHVGFVFRDDRGRAWMFEACPGDAKAVPLDNYAGRKLGLMRAPAQFIAERRNWQQFAGTDYAYRHLLWIALRERLGITVAYTATELCCSELVGLALRGAGVAIDWQCSPGVLAERLEALNHPIVAETA